MTLDAVKAMFPDAEIEHYPLGHGKFAIAATWQDAKGNKSRQSMMIPNGVDGMQTAATLLRSAVDALKA